MKILRCYIRIPPAVGGMENHIKTLTELQRSLGHEVDIAFNDGEKTNESDIQVFGSIKLFPNIKIPYTFLIFYLYLIFRLIIIKNKYDCIHLHGDWSSLLFVRTLKRLTSSSIVIFSIHDDISKKITHQKILPLLLKNIDLIFSTGHAAAKEIRRLTNKLVFVQPSGINKIFFDNTLYTDINDKFQVITVANLFPKKNIDLIIDIAQIMIDVNFIIVGDGTEKDRLNDKINTNKLKNVRLLGFNPPQEIKSLFEQSHCFLLTSIAEGTPTSALEAMACGLPIVSTNVGGIKNIIKDYENGFIIESFERDEFIEKIRFLQSNEMLRKTISASNKTLAKDYSWTKAAINITNKTIECFKNKQAQ